MDIADARSAPACMVTRTETKPVGPDGSSVVGERVIFIGAKVQLKNAFLFFMPKKQNRMKILPLPHFSQLTSVLQPIVSVRRGRVLGFEALCRHRGLSIMRSPSFLFEQAEHEGWRINLEHACVEHACTAFGEYCEAFEDSLLFVNVDAQVVASHTEYFDELAAIIESKGIPAERVVLELSGCG